MSAILTRRFRAALRYTAVSIGQLAEKSGFARITFDAYLNRQRPSRQAALALAKTLERRSKRLAEHARRLRELADDAPGTDRAVPETSP